MKILITGRPGIGKTTLIKKVFNFLSENFKNLKINGFITEEIREKGKRTGFKIIFLNQNKEFVFASIYFETNFKIGKYFVKVKEFENEIEKLMSINKDSDLLLIDEIGPMELLSNKFKKWIFTLLSNPNVNIIATVKENILKSIKEKAKDKFEVLVVRLNLKNRESEFDKIKEFLKKRLCQHSQ